MGNTQGCKACTSVLFKREQFKWFILKSSLVPQSFHWTFQHCLSQASFTQLSSAIQWHHVELLLANKSFSKYPFLSWYSCCLLCCEFILRSKFAKSRNPYQLISRFCPVHVHFDDLWPHGMIMRGFCTDSTAGMSSLCVKFTCKAGRQSG